MLRTLDILFALIGLILLSPAILIIYLIGLFDTGSPFFLQKRLGKNQQVFKLIKFRSMKIGTSQVGTHLAEVSDITNFGRFLRKSKLDELPQLINVAKGDMSLVGPRPGLPSQKTLLQQRIKRNVYSVRPGITGLGQVNEIDMSTPRKLSRYDQLMNSHMNLCFYFYLILATITGKGAGDRTSLGSKS